MADALARELDRGDIFRSPALQAAMKPEHHALRDHLQQALSVEAIAQLPRGERGFLAKEGWKILKELKLIGVSAPMRDGGMGLGLVGTAIVTEAANRSLDSGLSSALRIQNEIATPWLTTTKSQLVREEFGLPVVSGSRIACVCRTEQDHIWKSTMRREGDDLVIQARKALIVNCMNADVAIVVAQCEGAIAAVVVPMSMPNVRIARVHERWGAQLVDQVDMHFDDVRVPASYQLTTSTLQSTMMWNRIMCRARLTLALDAYFTMRALLQEALELAEARHIYVGQDVKRLLDLRAHQAAILEALGEYCRMADEIVGLVLALEAGRFAVYRAARIRWYAVEKTLQFARYCCTLAGGRSFTAAVSFMARYLQVFGLSMSGGSQVAMLELCKEGHKGGSGGGSYGGF